MRVLHVVKTSDGASWAANQVERLVRSGVEVHAALPSEQGRTVASWKASGAQVHIADLSLPLREPNHLPARLSAIRKLVDEIQPDLIHSHFVTNTLALRLALGKNHKVPRIFQVPGPLHLEHWHTRQPDLLTAGEADYWIGSSRCIVDNYHKAGIPSDRLFLSYYGSPVGGGSAGGTLRKRLELPASAKIVGTISYIYPPKYLLGECVGLKGHEYLIDALSIVAKKTDDVYGVLIGNALPGYGDRYEKTLRQRALTASDGRILMPGYFSHAEVQQSWPDFDCAVHVPLSENCGGVVEPLMAGVPVIASATGGLPEVVLDKITGRIVEGRSPHLLAQVILDVLSDLEFWRRTAIRGQRLVATMFDVNRTAAEIFSIYQHILVGALRPPFFHSERFVADVTELAHV